MAENHPIRLDLLFLFGTSNEKSRLISTILDLHSAAERVIDEVYKSRGNKLPNQPTFKNKISIFRSAIRRPLEKLNKARNLCAHRKPNFHEEKVAPILKLLEEIIIEIKSMSPGIFKSAESTFSSSALAAIYTITHLIADEYSIEISDPIILDGFYYPNQKTINERISEIIGDRA